MKIGNIEIDNRKAALGPMAGFTDMPFRRLCIEQGAGMTTTEMVSVNALHYGNKNTLPLLETAPGEHPVAIQLFGSDPERIAEEALKLEDRLEDSFDIFDINMGCPMAKVVNNGEGSALMKDAGLVGDIVNALSSKAAKPVTVKIRAGFDPAHKNAPEIAHIAEDNGAAAVAVHGRTREEYYSGKADWEVIGRVKAAVGIPVIGSGDVIDGPSAAAMLKATGCDMVMVARAARGNPWIFKEINHYLLTGEVLPRPSQQEVKNEILKHLEIMVEFAGEESAVRQLRKHVGFYCTGFANATHLRREINQAVTMDEFVKLISAW